MLFYEQPSDPWTRGDFKLLEAYQTLEDERCGDCGQPTWLCHSEQQDLQWEVRTQTCYAAKELDKWREKESKKKGKDKRPDAGLNPYVVPYVLKYGEDSQPVKDFENLPSRREFFESKTPSEDSA